MLFIIVVALVVIGIFVAVALLAPFWAMVAVSAAAVIGIALGARHGSRHDEVSGSMGIFSALLLTVATVVQWAVYLLARL